MLNNRRNVGDLIDVKQIASNANAWASQFIVKSNTQIISNNLTAKKAKMLSAAIEDIRTNLNSEPDAMDALVTLDHDDNIARFEQIIRAHAKYSVGNCYEFALFALDYVVIHAPQVEAELFHIVNGDHCFIVIGRDKHSDRSDPLTWGKNAYICDPWANKVYKASEYLNELNNYNYIRGIGRNISYLEPFNPSIHKLEPLEFNTQLLRKRETVDYKRSLLYNYAAALEAIRLELKKLQVRLSKADNTDRNTHLERVSFLITKIQSLEPSSINEHDDNDIKMPYRKLKAKLQCSLRQIIRAGETVLAASEQYLAKQPAAHLQFFKSRDNANASDQLVPRRPRYNAPY